MTLLCFIPLHFIETHPIMAQASTFSPVVSTHHTNIWDSLTTLVVLMIFLLFPPTQLQTHVFFIYIIFCYINIYIHSAQVCVSIVSFHSWYKWKWRAHKMIDMKTCLFPPVKRHSTRILHILLTHGNLTMLVSFMLTLYIYSKNYDLLLLSCGFKKVWINFLCCGGVGTAFRLVNDDGDGVFVDWSMIDKLKELDWYNQPFSSFFTFALYPQCQCRP